MADEKLKIQIETEARQAKEQIGEIKKEVVEFGKVSDSTSEDLKGLADKIEDVGEESKKTAEKAKGLGSMEVSLTDLMQLGRLVGDVFKGMGEQISESLKRSAESGDESSKALLGGFEKVREVVDRVVGVFVKDMAPAVLPLVNLFADLAKQVGDWAQSSNAGSEVGKQLVGVVLTLGTAFEQMISIAISGFVKIIQLGADATSAFDNEAANNLDIYAKRVGEFGKAWDATAASIEASIAKIEAGQTKLSDSEVAALAKSYDAHEEHKQKAVAAEQEQTEALKNQADERIATLDAFWARARELQQQAIEEQHATQVEADQIYLDEMLRLNEEQATSSEDLAARNRAVYAQIEADESLSMEIRTAAHKKMVAMRRADNDRMLAQEKATQAKISETQAQAAAQQLKSEQAKQLKMGEIVAQGLGLILGKTKDWGTQILTLAKKHASEQLSVLQSQVVAEIQEYQALSSKYGQTEATMMLQSKSSMAAKLASAFAPLGPFAVPATAAAIAAMSAVVNAVGGAFKFESGKTSSGRPVGLGNADPDAPNAHVGPDETVLTGAQTRALGGSEAILAAAAGQGQQGGGAPGRMDVYVHHVFDGIPSSLKAILRPWMPTVLEAIDEQVLRYRSKLTATHFLSARNPA